MIETSIEPQKNIEIKLVYELPSKIPSVVAMNPIDNICIYDTISETIERIVELGRIRFKIEAKVRCKSA